MRPFIFNPGPKLVAGSLKPDALAEALPPGPCLVVTDKELVELHLIDAYVEAIAATRELVLFDEVEADPSRETLLNATEAGRASKVRSVVGFGGGSPMDVAKLAAYLLGSGDELDRIWGVGLAKGTRLPLALVPTTAGTGSEATPISVITCEGGVKLAVNAQPLTADLAILDPALTVSLPRHVTAATGIDAIVHSIEAYTSARLKNPLSDAFARQALGLLTSNLLTAMDEPRNLDARSAMLLGAHLAGLAFANAPVAGVHALAYPLGGLHHLPHGLTNALMLRHVLGHNMDSAREHYAELAEIMDPSCIGEGSQMRAAIFVERLESLVRNSGLALRLRDHGVAFDEAPVLAREAMKQGRLLVNNPCEITQSDAQRLYEAAW